MPKPPTTTEKPYNNCLPCQHRKEGRCDGPRTSAMPLGRWCEFMRDLKAANGLTNQQISDRSGVSIKTIERIMAGSCDKDIYRDTARLIENAIIGSSNQYPCYLAFEQLIPQDSQQLADAIREAERLAADNSEYKQALSAIHGSYNQELQAIRDEAQVKIDFLRQRIDVLTDLLGSAQREKEYLLEENKRKSRIVDKFIENI